MTSPDLPHRDFLTCFIAATPPVTSRTTPVDGAGAFLQERIDRLQARCDALQGKPGYRRMLARLTDAKTAALASGVRS